MITKKNNKSLNLKLIESIKTIAIALIFAGVIRSFLFEPFLYSI